MRYQPQVLTLEEFETLKALTDCLFPHQEVELAAMFDRALHEAKREPWSLADLPPDAKGIRSGLQLLNYDSLRSEGRPFAHLTNQRRKDLLASLQLDGDMRWPQFAAAKWFEEVVAITNELYLSSPDRMLGQSLQTGEHAFLPVFFSGTKANLFP